MGCQAGILEVFRLEKIPALKRKNHTKTGVMISDAGNSDGPILVSPDKQSRLGHLDVTRTHNFRRKITFCKDADDTIIFGCFQRISGIKIKFSKSCLVGVGLGLIIK